MEAIKAELVLPGAWIPQQPTTVGPLRLRRGPQPQLRYLDPQLEGLTLAIEMLDAQQPVDELRHRVADPPPGVLALVAGHVPIERRPALREREISFLASDGTAELFWPMLRVTASRLNQPIQRVTPAVTLRGTHARVVQALLTTHFSGQRFDSSGELANRATVSPPVVSRLLHKLARHGLVELERDGRRKRPHVTDPTALAELLRDQRGWPRQTAYGYVYGRSVLDRAAAIEAACSEQDARTVGLVRAAFTGAAGAATRGVLMTGDPILQVWLDAPADKPDDGAGEASLLAAGIEPAPRSAATCEVAFDRDGIGFQGAQRRPLPDGDGQLLVAAAIRVWCDLHHLPRGDDVAAQMWQVLT